MNKLWTALKENTNDVRKNFLIAVGTVAGAIAAGLVLSKLSDDTERVIILQEAQPVEFVEIPTEPTES